MYVLTKNKYIYIYRESMCVTSKVLSQCWSGDEVLIYNCQILQMCFATIIGSTFGKSLKGKFIQLIQYSPDGQWF